MRRSNPRILRTLIFQNPRELTGCIADDLRLYFISPTVVNSPGALMQRLEMSNRWDLLIVEAAAQWQGTLDIVRTTRRIRERLGSSPLPLILVLATVQHHPVTIDLFKRTSGTQYVRLTSQQDLAAVFS